MRIERVSWVDSASHGDGWHDLDEIVETVEKYGLLKIESIGYVVHEDDRSLTIALSWSPGPDGDPFRICQPLTIPKAVIASRSQVQNSQPKGQA